MDKPQLRNHILAQLKQLSTEYVATASQSIIDQLVELVEARKAQIITSFAPFKTEPQIQPFDQRFVIHLPVVYPNGQMDMRDPVGQVIPPGQVDLIIIPCLAFDPKTKTRLGRGGGYYDRYLPKCINATKVIVAFSIQSVEGLPTETHDIPADLIITER